MRTQPFSALPVHHDFAPSAPPIHLAPSKQAQSYTNYADITNSANNGASNLNHDTNNANGRNTANDSKHIAYAVQLLIFTLVGWGWLSLRELLGSTPVLDVVVFVSLLSAGVINLCLALVFYSIGQFEGYAQAFFSHSLAVWILYCYSLLESTGSGYTPLVCQKNGSYTLPSTYASAFFGGLPVHQAAAAVTLAFLTVHLIISAAQVRASVQMPRQWFAPGTGQAVMVLICLHLVIFVFCAPLQAGNHALAGVVAVVTALLWLSMIRFDWLASLSFQAQLQGSDTARNAFIQFLTETACMGLLFLMSFSLAALLAGGFPLTIFLCESAVLIGQAVVKWWSMQEAAQSSMARQFVLPSRVRLLARRNWESADGKRM